MIIVVKCSCSECYKEMIHDIDDTILPVMVTTVLLMDDNTGSPVTLILTRQEISYCPGDENICVNVLELTAARGVLGIVALLVTSTLLIVQTKTLSNSRSTSNSRGTVPIQLNVN